MTLKEQAQICADLIRNSKHIAVLSGAGMSTAAGIPDFRGPQGIYNRVDVDADKLFDISYFQINPSYYYKFHKECAKMLAGIEPTFTHKFLAKLEADGKLDGIVTQNFDGLHEAAGNSRVYTIHGTIRHAYCTKCHKHYGYDAVNEQLKTVSTPKCSCGGVIKPDIVFFGENVKYLPECQDLCEKADLLFVLGSSLNVYPAALLPQLCRGKVIVVNKGSVSHYYLPPERIALRVEQDLDTFFKAVAELL